MTTVTELRDRGIDWIEIAERLDIAPGENRHGRVGEAMQRWRNENYEHWDTGWELSVEDGIHSRIEAGPFKIYPEGGEARVLIEELHDDIPLNVDYTIESDEGDVEVGVMMPLDPDEARSLAVTLLECADIVEEDAEYP